MSAIDRPGLAPGDAAQDRNARTGRDQDSSVVATASANRNQADRWIEAARAGSTAALGQLLEGCRKYLLLVANRSLDSDLRPKAGASDLVQDTFVDAQRDFGDFQGSTEEEFHAWLLGILANRLANHVRRYRHTHKRDVDRELHLEYGAEGLLVSAAGADQSPSKLAAAREKQQRLQAALARLPDLNRRVLTMRTWEQASFAEIGAALEISSEAARKVWSRSVQRLATELREEA